MGVALSQRLGRRPGLDGVRAIAILAVLLTHGISRLFPGGALGVDIFFALSGFLITTLLLEEFADTGRIRLGWFWARRGLRLLPALLVFLLAAAAIALYAGAALPLVAWSSLSVVFYATNVVRVLGAPFAPGMGHTWSLALEEQFYLVWPLIFVAIMLMRRHRRWLIVFLTTLVVAAPVWRAVLALSGSSYNRIKFSPDTRFDQLAIGCLLAVLVSYGIVRLTRPRLLAFLTIISALYLGGWLLVGGPRFATYLAIAGYTMIGLATCVLIFASMQHGAAGRILSWRPLVWIGRRSYGIYLWHIATILFFDTLLPKQWWLAAAALGIASGIGLAALSYRFVEKPFLRMKGRFEPTRGEARASAATVRAADGVRSIRRKNGGGSDGRWSGTRDSSADAPKDTVGE